jgi:hypothetical protein
MAQPIFPVGQKLRGDIRSSEAVAIEFTIKLKSGKLLC